MGEQVQQETDIKLTPSAAARIATILANESEGTALRISVDGGGCSGFSYKYDLVQEQHDDDLILSAQNAVVLIDPITVPFMAGSEIDFVDNLMGQSFQINNPNATASCGCGTSFSI